MRKVILTIAATAILGVSFSAPRANAVVEHIRVEPATTSMSAPCLPYINYLNYCNHPVYQISIVEISSKVGGVYGAEL